MHRAGGEKPPASFGKRTALHHLISAGNLGFAAWRDGGFTVHDLTDPPNPKLLAHHNTSPPFAGGAHTPLPLPDRNLVVLADEATAVELRQRACLHLDIRRARAVPTRSR